MISCSWEFKELAEFPAEVRGISEVLERCIRLGEEEKESHRAKNAP